MAAAVSASCNCLRCCNVGELSCGVALALQILSQVSWGSVLCHFVGVVAPKLSVGDFCELFGGSVVVVVAVVSAAAGAAAGVVGVVAVAL